MYLLESQQENTKLFIGVLYNKNMNKKKYEKPDIELIKLTDTNIITNSWEEWDDDPFGMG